MRMINIATLVLVIVGALNWGLMGLFQVDLVATLFGGPQTALSRIVYVLVGLSGLYQPDCPPSQRYVGARRQSSACDGRPALSSVVPRLARPVMAGPPSPRLPCKASSGVCSECELRPEGVSRRACSWRRRCIPSRQRSRFSEQEQLLELGLCGTGGCRAETRRT